MPLQYCSSLKEISRPIIDDISSSLVSSRCDDPVDDNPSVPWLLLGGVWNDEGIWRDSAVWID